MDLALAGAGAASVVHALAASAAGAPIVAVASRTGVSARERAGQVGARVVASDALPAGADAVIICTPPDRHASDTTAVLEAGGVVLVETPLATTLADADALVDRDGRVLYGEHLAHSPVVDALQTMTRGVGAIGYVEIRLLSPRPDWGTYLDPAGGGGALFHLGAHGIALALLVLPDDRPVGVRATVQASSGLPVDDRAEVLMRFASGAVARVEVDWGAPSSIWDVQVSSDTDVVRADLLPVAGLEHNGDPVALPPRHHDVDPHIELLGHVAQLQELARVVDGDTPSVDVRFGREVLEIVYAAYRAAATGTDEPLPYTGRRDVTPITLWRQGP